MGNFNKIILVTDYNHQLYTIFPLQITVIIIHLSISNHSHYHRDIIFLGDEQPVVALPDVWFGRQYSFLLLKTARKVLYMTRYYGWAMYKQYIFWTRYHVRLWKMTKNGGRDISTLPVKRLNWRQFNLI